MSKPIDGKLPFFTMPVVFRALNNRVFALFLGGQGLSRIADFLYQIIVAWWVLEETGSAVAMASLLIISFAPTLVFLLIGGVLVDRVSRIMVLLGSDLLRGGVVGTVALLAAFDLLELQHLYLLNLLFGIADAFFHPAYAATVPDLVADDDLPSANTLSSMSIQIGRIAGPAIGATLVALGGTRLAFALTTLAFVAASALLLPLMRLYPARPATPPTPATPIAGIVTDVREGIGTVLTTPWLWSTILIFGLSNVALSGPYSIALPILVHNNLGAEVETLGLLHALFAAGYVIGSLWLGRYTQLRRRGQLVYGGIALAGLFLALFGLPLPLIVLGLAALINGIALEIGNLAWLSVMQQFIPREQLGRVASIDALGSFALIPLGYALTGWATDLLGAAVVFAVGGSFTALAAGVFLLVQPAIRRLD